MKEDALTRRLLSESFDAQVRFNEVAATLRRRREEWKCEHGNMLDAAMAAGALVEKTTQQLTAIGVTAPDIIADDGLLKTIADVRHERQRGEGGHN